MQREEDRLDTRESAIGDAERRQGDRKHVLAVNGDPAFLELIRELLQEERYNVTTTNYVPRTFDLIAALQPALLIVNLVIHQIAGWDLLDRLQREAITQGIPVIVTSTTPQLLERAKADQQRYGGNKYLVKPFDVEDLLKTIQQLIGTAGPVTGACRRHGPSAPRTRRMCVGGIHSCFSSHHIHWKWPKPLALSPNSGRILGTTD